MGQRISQLDLAGPLSGSELLVLVQEGKTKKAQASSFTPLLSSSCQCTLVSRYNSVGTDADTLEKYLQTWQYPGGTLRTNGSWLEIIAWGSAGNNNNNKEVSITFGATKISSGSGAVRNFWELRATILRSSSSTQKMKAKFITQGTSTTWSASVSGIGVLANPTENLNIDIPFSISAQNGTANANDITIEGFIIELHQIDVNS